MGVYRGREDLGLISRSGIGGDRSSDSLGYERGKGGFLWAEGCRMRGV